MYFRHPTFLWAAVVPALVLVGWVFAELRRKRQLKAFGDPVVMGMSLPWAPRAAGVFFLTMGLAATAALLPLPAFEGEEKSAAPPVIRILIDVRSMDFEDNRIWQTLEDAVERVLQQAAGLRCSIVVPGRPLETWVPATEDGKGLQILLARLRFDLQRDLHPALSEILHAVAGPIPSLPVGSGLVIITALPSGEVEKLFEESPEGKIELPIVSLSRSGEPVQFGTRSMETGWAWTAQAGSFPEFSRATKQGGQDEGRHLGALQQFALLALLLLSLEFMCSLAARSTMAGDRLA